MEHHFIIHILQSDTIPTPNCYMDYYKRFENYLNENVFGLCALYYL